MIWNKLPLQAVNANSLNVSKAQIDKVLIKLYLFILELF